MKLIIFLIISCSAILCVSAGFGNFGKGEQFNKAKIPKPTQFGERSKEELKKADRCAKQSMGNIRKLIWLILTLFIKYDVFFLVKFLKMDHRNTSTDLEHFVSDMNCTGLLFQDFSALGCLAASGDAVSSDKFWMCMSKFSRWLLTKTQYFISIFLKEPTTKKRAIDLYNKELKDTYCHITRRKLCQNGCKFMTWKNSLVDLIFKFIRFQHLKAKNLSKFLLMTPHQ